MIKQESIIKTKEYNIYLNDDGYSYLKTHLDKANYASVFVLVDSLTKIHCLPIFKEKGIGYNKVIEIEEGETNKNLDSLKNILLDLSSSGADRNSLLINLGGGVVTDIGGFAASIFKRGIDFINIPTTLLSMVDASVGGKTGIDLDQLKNQVGTFSFPKMIIVDSIYLKTLERRELLSGFAEMLKHGLISDKGLWDELRILKEIEINTLSPFIKKSILIKKEVVESDPFEKGLRKVLNFGHTIGHAVESFYLTTKNRYLHGEAIAIGMICEAHLAYQINELNSIDLEQITFFFLNCYSNIGELQKSDFDAILDWAKHDKKNKAKEINFSLIKGIGNCGFNIVLKREQIISSLEYYNQSVIKNN